MQHFAQDFFNQHQLHVTAAYKIIADYNQPQSVNVNRINYAVNRYLNYNQQPKLQTAINKQYATIHDMSVVRMTINISFLRR